MPKLCTCSTSKKFSLWSFTVLCNLLCAVERDYITLTSCILVSLDCNFHSSIVGFYNVL